MLRFKVPSGIGDVSWLYSKLVNLGRPFNLEICGDEPRRTLPFTDLLPMVDQAEYGDWTYWKTFREEMKGLPPDTNLFDLDEGEYYLSLNQWLEMGCKLEGAFREMDTDYHYDMNTDEHSEKPEIWLDSNDFQEPFIGVYTSKYDSYKADWRFWKHQGWVEFLNKIYERLDGCTFVFIGAKFDMDLGQLVSCLMNKTAPTICLIGQTHIGEAIEVIKRCSYLFAYASGIGIMSDVVMTPAIHFLPTPRHDTLVDTYADPKSIEIGHHINQLFCSVDEAVKVFEEKGLEYV